MNEIDCPHCQARYADSVFPISSVNVAGPTINYGVRVQCGGCSEWFRIRIKKDTETTVTT